MVEIAKEQTAAHSSVERFSYFEGGVESLPIDDVRADIVLAFDSFDHRQDQSKGLLEVRRVLKREDQFVELKDGDLPNGASVKNSLSAL